MYITICKIDDQCKFNAWSGAPKSGALGQSRGMGWGEWWEGASRWWDTCTPMAESCHVWQKPTQYWKAIILQLKINNFLKINFFNWRLITLQHCGFCHTLTWISHGCTCVPHPEHPSHFPPHSIPLGCPSAPALSPLFHALNLNWCSISHMVIYIFQCYSLIIPPSPFGPRVQKSVLYICVSFAVLHIGSSF